MSPRYCVWIDGVKVQFDKKPTPAMIEQAGETMKTIMSKLPELTPEQIERQDAARIRNRERLDRIRGAS